MNVNNCDHELFSVDMEHLLLDDENVVNSCLKCRKTNLENGQIEQDLCSQKLLIEEPNFYDTRHESSEDSPLLANGDFRDSELFHCHSSLSFTNGDSKALKKLLMASVFCFAFMIAEIVGGYFAGSLAVMTDAAHLFSDFIGFIISILAIFLSKKSATKLMTFGYYRAEVVGAFLSVLTIWFLAAIFLILALRRLYKEEYSIQADTMIIVASIGLIVNIIMGAVLHGVCHSHNHQSSSSALQNQHHHHHQHDNINVRAAAAHVLGDLLQSFGVLLSAIIIKIFPQARAVDPICTLIFSVIIIFTTAQVGKDSVWLLMQGSPLPRDRLLLELRKLVGIKHIHDLNIWSLAPGRNVVTVHLAVDNYCDRDVIIEKATDSIKSQLSIFSCTIQVESFNADAVDSCNQCRIRES